MLRMPILILGAAACATVSACDKHRESTAGWLKVVVDTAYKGEPVHFDAYAQCVGKYVRGGSFGATPGTGTISMRPKSVGKVMSDGSFVAFQLPDLCGRYFDNRDPWTFTPTSFVPVMVWADKKRRPAAMESYLSVEALEGPGSKLGPSTGTATPLAALDERLAAATRALPNVVLQDSHKIAAETEIGYKSGERGFRAAFGWPSLGVDGDAAIYDCMQHFRYGQLVRGREVLSRLTFEKCEKSLASVVPFLWDGKQYNADLEHRGMLIFQRVDPRMNEKRSYLVGNDVVWPEMDRSAISQNPQFHISWISAPAGDPNQGI
jgi:hypothetical protein